MLLADRDGGCLCSIITLESQERFFTVDFWKGEEKKAAALVQESVKKADVLSLK